MEFIKKHIWIVVGLFVGALAGFFYWKYVGCVSGSCAITSRPLNSTIYGALVGGYLFSLFNKSKIKTNDI